MTLLLGLVLISPMVWSQAPSIPKTGEASFDAAGVRITYSNVTGTIRESHFGDTTYSANLLFTPDGKPGGDYLAIEVLVQQAGPANMQAKAGNGVIYRSGHDTFMHYKGKSRCTMRVFKITRTYVEGVADCPVLHKQHGTDVDTMAVQQIRFSASAD